MKKIIYLFALAVLITACSKDDNANNPNDIIGTWELEYEYADVLRSPIDFNKATSYERHESRDVRVTFLSDTTCGMIYRYKDGTPDFASSYYMDNKNIYEIKRCNDNLACNYIYPYKMLTYDTLIIADAYTASISYFFYSRIE